MTQLHCRWPENSKSRTNLPASSNSRHWVPAPICSFGSSRLPEASLRRDRHFCHPPLFKRRRPRPRSSEREIPNWLRTPPLSESRHGLLFSCLDLVLASLAQSRYLCGSRVLTHSWRSVRNCDTFRPFGDVPWAIKRRGSWLSLSSFTPKMSFFPSLSALRPLLLLAGCLVTILFVRAAAARKRRNPRGLPLPPGPKGLPVIGNLRDMPADDKHPWKAYHELCKEYGGCQQSVFRGLLLILRVSGGMVYMSVMGQGTLVLGTLPHAVQLLDRRAATYSDRPILPALEL